MKTFFLLAAAGLSACASVTQSRHVASEASSPRLSGTYGGSVVNRDGGEVLGQLDITLVATPQTAGRTGIDGIAVLTNGGVIGTGVIADASVSTTLFRGNQISGSVLIPSASEPKKAMALEAELNGNTLTGNLSFPDRPGIKGHFELERRSADPVSHTFSYTGSAGGVPVVLRIDTMPIGSVLNNTFSELKQATAVASVGSSYTPPLPCDLDPKAGKLNCTGTTVRMGLPMAVSLQCTRSNGNGYACTLNNMASGQTTSFEVAPE